MLYVHGHLYANVAQNSTCINTKNIVSIWIINFLINNSVHIFNVNIILLYNYIRFVLNTQICYWISMLIFTKNWPILLSFD